MNKLINTLQVANWGGCILGIGFTEFTGAVFMILSIISLLISIVSGALVIWLRIKQARADGKITEEEAKSILGEIQGLKSEIKEDIENIKNASGKEQ